MERHRRLGVVLAALFAFALAMPTSAQAPSGAIFTTLADGSEVNFNIYPSKDAVYLDGGPGPGAPQHAAGLDDGTYVFQVTDPSGKTLLSTDPARCRQFTVAGGIISGVVDNDCEHATGLDIDHGAVTVQLMPYNDTPNPGGVYKVWVTLVGNYQCNLNQVDCGGRKASKSVHGFLPRYSKTDNFKVKNLPVEIDTRFFLDLDGDGHFSAGEAYIDGLQVTWTDTLGASNIKWSYNDPSIWVEHEAHVEAAEPGTHYITIADQPGCAVGLIHRDYDHMGDGPQTVPVQILSTDTDRTVYIDVACKVS